MIDVDVLYYEDHSYKIDKISVKIEDISENERVEKLLKENKKKIEEIPVPSLSTDLIEHIAEILEVDASMINLDAESYLYENEIAALGFSEEDREAVWSSLSLTHIMMEDWESMLLFENDKEIFYHLYIDEDYDKEDYIRTITEMCETSDIALKEGRSLLERMIEENASNFIGKVMKLPSGKWFILPEKLLSKDMQYQMD
jgi:hypothetical protein